MESVARYRINTFGLDEGDQENRINWPSTTPALYPERPHTDSRLLLLRSKLPSGKQNLCFLPEPSDVEEPSDSVNNKTQLLNIPHTCSNSDHE